MSAPLYLRFSPRAGSSARLISLAKSLVFSESSPVPGDEAVVGRIREAAELNIPLVLSGHTHGGQIVLPGIGAWNRGFFPTMQGTLERENSVLFVSRGIGMVYVPVRLNCPPEIAMLTLQRRGAFS